MLECVINISEGTDQNILADLGKSCSRSLLDVHSDSDHNRSVFTLAGADVEEDARFLASSALSRIDLASHVGVHPRFGVVDVVPFVPITESGATFEEAMHARNSFAQWMAERGVPCFLYGPERTLPYVRKHAFVELTPTVGATSPHITGGGCAVGARNYMVAYNLWLEPGVSMTQARAAARALRGPHLRTLALQVGERLQISCNLIEPSKVGPAEAYDLVDNLLKVAEAELVGLIPASVLTAASSQRWTQLGISADRTIEAHLSGLR